MSKCLLEEPGKCEVATDLGFETFIRSLAAEEYKIAIDFANRFRESRESSQESETAQSGDAFSDMSAENGKEYGSASETSCALSIEKPPPIRVQECGITLDMSPTQSIEKQAGKETRGSSQCEAANKTSSAAPKLPHLHQTAYSSSDPWNSLERQCDADEIQPRHEMHASLASSLGVLQYGMVTWPRGHAHTLQESSSGPYRVTDWKSGRHLSWNTAVDIRYPHRNSLVDNALPRHMHSRAGKLSSYDKNSGKWSRSGLCQIQERGKVGCVYNQSFVEQGTSMPHHSKSSHGSQHGKVHVPSHGGMNGHHDHKRRALKWANTPDRLAEGLSNASCADLKRLVHIE